MYESHAYLEARFLTILTKLKSVSKDHSEIDAKTHSRVSL